MYVICLSLKIKVTLREECFRSFLILKREVLVKIGLKGLVEYGIYSHRRLC